MTEEEIQKNIDAANEHQNQRRLTSDARAEFKKALLDYTLNADENHVTLEQTLHDAQIKCLSLGMTPPELGGLVDHWTKLLYGGHFRRTG